jgi:hypothetical protein
METRADESTLDGAHIHDPEPDPWDDGDPADGLRASARVTGRALSQMLRSKLRQRRQRVESR